MNKSIENKIRKIFTGKGDSKLITIKPDGDGSYEVLLEDNMDKPIFCMSHLRSVKDCEVALAMYLLLKNGYEPNTMVRAAERQVVKVEIRPSDSRQNVQSDAAMIKKAKGFLLPSGGRS